MAPAAMLLLLIKLRHGTFGKMKKHHHAVLMAGRMSDGVGGIVDHGPRPGHREEARVALYLRFCGSDEIKYLFERAR